MQINILLTITDVHHQAELRVRVRDIRRSCRCRMMQTLWILF